MCRENPRLQMNHERALVKILLDNGTARERKRLWKSFPQSFRGCDAVRVWISSGLVGSIEDAIIEGTLLVKMGLVRHAAGRGDFENSSALFVVTKSRLINQERPKPKKLFNNRELITAIKENGLGRARRYRLRRHENCFVASEAVKLWVTAGCVRNNNEAVAAGQHLLTTGVIKHVGGLSTFENEKLLYKITEQDINKLEALPLQVQLFDDRLSLTQKFGGGVAAKGPGEKKTFDMLGADENIEEPFSLHVSIGRRINDLARTFSVDFSNQAPESADSPVPFFEDRTVPFFEPVSAK
mmetsp:Transcript_1830/g.5529  ORF Transcript_1830/g.5529 Transcript_1830/m.5529 type:complete len:297 (+) Transcript_1830:230-1120(+)|eukprot:CAMPEP_0198727496 /NCGR_PEP_ID=MMETSP1475-20131203/4276_1 /TAXON_ID= ORGANISM="Unidentified sp., Strain CCMP1999" /NCGR_SAMPLE_ID=MMETSP1475 /ASSEMBLY_ACC=CAM_ASM_001111 /LENGTH=296 /DNA_ID=CAMNT_0044489543 /DNA_START=143 /DNA_END=1033 /DNA_ORIENTATION=-